MSLSKCIHVIWKHKKGRHYRVEFKVRNIKPIPNNIEFGFFYINDDFLFFNKIEAQLRYIKFGDSETLVIEYRNSVYPDSVYKLENATSLHFRF